MRVGFPQRAGVACPLQFSNCPSARVVIRVHRLSPSGAVVVCPSSRQLSVPGSSALFLSPLVNLSRKKVAPVSADSARLFPGIRTFL
jgi:hypothetical protein